VNLWPLTIRLQHEVPGVIEAPAPSDPHIVVHLGKSIDIECHRAGKRYRGKTVHGDVDIIPTGMASRWVLRETGSDVLVRVSRQLLETAAEERGADLSDVTLFDRFQARDPQIESLVWALKAEMEGGYTSGEMFVESVGLALASRMLHSHSSLASRTVTEATGGLSGHRLRQVLTYIDENLGEALTLQKIAAASGLSVSHCQRAFRKSIGISVHRYVIQRRVETARRLLADADGEIPLARVALDVGFSHQSHLAHHMRRLLGFSPSKLRSRSQS
jgi:AraC family transcriptional regulator